MPSFDELRVRGEVVGRALTDSDSDWVIVEEMGMLALSCLPGQMVKIRADQVMNSMGGYVFAVSDETHVRRFLILGCSGGTYYSTEKALTLDNLEALKDIIHRGKASMILSEIREISLAGRNPKQEPVMLALALCARYMVHSVGTKAPTKAGQLYQAYLQQMHKDALALVNEVCRIPTHLFMFIKFCEMVAADVIVTKDEIAEAKAAKKARKAAKAAGDELPVVEAKPAPKPKSTGWGRTMRTTIANWYTSRTPEQLAMHITKYANREGWTHKDALRLSHPVVAKDDLVMRQIFTYAVKGKLEPRKRSLPADSEEGKAAAQMYSAEKLTAEAESKALALIEAYSGLNKDSTEEQIVAAIKEHGLVREHVPTEALSKAGVWRALLEKMPMTAMIRNLAKMQVLEILQGEYLCKVVNQLTDVEMLKKARIHPIQILLAKAIYDQGRGDKGKLEWTPNKELSMALEKAFYKAFINVPPTNKRFCLAFDISGSMTCGISGTCISARTASAAIGLNLLKVEKNVECVGFCDTLEKLPYNGDWTLEKVSNHMDSLRMGMTNCALPMQWALEQKKQFDAFIVFTDNETYFGEVHPFEALKAYRAGMGIDARLIVAGMTATNFTIADPTDAGMLDVVGFDSAVPELISKFVLGQI